MDLYSAFAQPLQDLSRQSVGNGESMLADGLEVMYRARRLIPFPLGVSLVAVSLVGDNATRIQSSECC